MQMTLLCKARIIKELRGTDLNLKSSVVKCKNAKKSSRVALETNEIDITTSLRLISQKIRFQNHVPRKLQNE